MDSREFLRQAAMAERELKTLKSLLDHFEDIGLSMSMPLGRTGSGQKGSSRVEAASIGMVDTEREIRAKIAEYSGIVKTAWKLINKIPQERYRRILSLHYLSGWSLQAVSDDLRYNDRNSIYRALRYALTEFDKVMTEAGIK